MPIVRMTTPIPLLVFVYALTMTTSFHAVEGHVWSPCGIRGEPSLPQASRGDVSIKHCFVDTPTFSAFEDITPGEYQNKVFAAINPATDDIGRRTNESGVTFLCRGLVLMNSFIQELDRADEHSWEVDITTLRHRFVVAYELLNTSLTTMITRCPLLTLAPIQLEEVDTRASVSLLPAAGDESNWIKFLKAKIQPVLDKLRVRRLGTGAGCPNSSDDMLCVMSGASR